MLSLFLASIIAPFIVLAIAKTLANQERYRNDYARLPQPTLRDGRDDLNVTDFHKWNTARATHEELERYSAGLGIRNFVKSVDFDAMVGGIAAIRLLIDSDAWATLPEPAKKDIENICKQPWPHTKVLLFVCDDGRVLQRCEL